MKSDFERSARPVDLTTDVAHEFDLPSLSSRLMNGETTSKSGKTALTLARDDRMTVVLTVMKEGAELQTHKADCPITVNVLAGRIVFTVGTEEKQVAVSAGGALVMPSGLSHSARALNDSSFLLVIGGRGM